MGFFNNNNVTAMEAAVESANAEEQAVRQQDQETGQDENIMQMPEQKRKPFATWDVGGRTYRLKLRTSAIVELEARYKTNLMNIMGAGEGGMPALSVMLDVAHAAMKEWQHGISKTEVQNLFQQYVDEGGSQLSFYTSVYMEIFTVSGFFSVNLSNQMQNAMTEAQETM